MKPVLLFTLLSVGLAAALSAQEIKTDLRPQPEKEDPNNLHRAADLTTLDLLQALDMAGIAIRKFELGRFDRPYDLLLFAEEYRDGKPVRTDTLLAAENTYAFFERGKEGYFLDFIDRLKIITKDEDNASTLRIHTYAMMTNKKIELPRTDDEQFFTWRSYADTHWKPNEKVPLMVFASSWKDRQYGFQRFCGVAHLAANDEGTKELLSMSPNYIVISYKVTEAAGAQGR